MAVRVAIPLAVEELRGQPIPMSMVSEAGDRARGRRLRGRRHSRRGVGRGVARRVSQAPAGPRAGRLIVTGRNIDDDLHRRCVEDPDSFPD
jgi:hypothetical protein